VSTSTCPWETVVTASRDAVGLSESVAVLRLSFVGVSLASGIHCERPGCDERLGRFGGLPSWR